MTDGDVHPGAMPDDLDVLLDELRAAAAASPPPEPGAALTTLFRDGTAPVLAPAARRRRRRAIGVGIAAAAAALGFGGLGVAGALPSPVQARVADIADQVGVNLPDGRPSATTSTTGPSPDAPRPTGSTTPSGSTPAGPVDRGDEPPVDEPTPRSTVPDRRPDDAPGATDPDRRPDQPPGSTAPDPPAGDDDGPTVRRAENASASRNDDADRNSREADHVDAIDRSGRGPAANGGST